MVTMTPVHMRHHHHSLGEVGFVIGMHIGAMFLPSLHVGPMLRRCPGSFEPVVGSI